MVMTKSSCEVSFESTEISSMDSYKESLSIGASVEGGKQIFFYLIKHNFFFFRFLFELINLIYLIIILL